MQLLLRLFANCDDDSAARDIQGRLAHALHRFSPTERASPGRYWKMQELHEFTFTLMPPTPDSFFSIVDMVSGGWIHSPGTEELSAVWNRRSDHCFLSPEVSWANLELQASAEP